MTYDKSKIDELFHELYGFYPGKEGQSYEMLVNAVFKILSEDSTVKNNQHLRGIYSKQVYQIDGIIQTNNITEAIESKDYTKRESPVGRPDIQKLEGGLIDIEAVSGRFASATGYTRNANKYAAGTTVNPVTKKIELYDIRPSTEEDESGRIKFIQLNLIAKDLDFNNALFEPRFTKKGYDTIIPILKEKYPNIQNNEDLPLNISIEFIYIEDGTIFTSIAEWSKTINIELQSDHNEVYATWLLKNKFLMIENTLIEIAGIEYRIPINIFKHTIHLSADGNAKLLVKNDAGSVDTLITDLKLKNVYFNNGEVLINKC